MKLQNEQNNEQNEHKNIKIFFINKIKNYKICIQCSSFFATNVANNYKIPRENIVLQFIKFLSKYFIFNVVPVFYF